MNEWVGLFLFFATVALAGLSGAIFRPGDWYKALNKPSWTPPSWLFRPAWTLLYVMISVAGWLVWRNEGFGLALAVWCLNIGFNAGWSWLMFEKRRIDLALIDAAGILATILMFIMAAWPHSPAAALLFVPYLLWVAFATALTYSLLQRNSPAP
jgi:translocator protein